MQQNFSINREHVGIKYLESRNRNIISADVDPFVPHSDDIAKFVGDHFYIQYGKYSDRISVTSNGPTCYIM